MAQNRRSSAARRREQIRERKERQRRMIRVGAAILAAVVVIALILVVWQTIGGRAPEGATAEENSEAMSLYDAARMETERPLAELDPSQRNGYYSAPPEMVIDPDNDYQAVIRTNKGDIRLQLFASRAPQTVNNFVFLANQGYYDGVPFHRVLEDFMAQAGDPSGTGSGGPGYTFDDEFHPELKHDQPGTLSMANAGFGTNGSQFFITFVPTPWLDAYDAQGQLKDCRQRSVSCHAVFGRVTEGIEVLDNITRRQPGGAPADTIERIDIFESS